MSHKIVAIGHSDNSVIKLYLKNQLDAIKEYKSGVTTEEGDETYSLIFSNVIPEKRTRFPMMMYIKNNKFVTAKHGKHELKEMLAWIDSLGINA